MRIATTPTRHFSPGKALMVLLIIAAATLAVVPALPSLSGEAAAQNCDPNYVPCIPPPPPDLNCDDLRIGIRVIGSEDPHGLDRDGDGRACESYGPIPDAPTTTTTSTSTTTSSTSTSTSTTVVAPKPELCGGEPITIWGTSANDVIVGTNGDDVIFADAGNDKVKAGKGDDIVCGGNGNDKLFGGSGDDTLYGEKGNDRLNGQNGGDALYGGGGKDKLNGGKANDFCNGQGGKDTASKCEKTRKL